METNLADFIRDTPEGREADAILRKCVHCGFCTATCPTYQLLGDELDGPRGRIYLMKQVLEGARPTRKTQLHLDRCLTCRNCETTCPSACNTAAWWTSAARSSSSRCGAAPAKRCSAGCCEPSAASLAMFSAALKLGRWRGRCCRARSKRKVPQQVQPGPGLRPRHARKMLVLEGCVQPAMSPNINAATARVLDKLGISLIATRPQAGCCGAVSYPPELRRTKALDYMRRNIDAWWPYVEQGVEAIVITASGCASMIAEYGHLLRNDPAYRDKALRISTLMKDISEIMLAEKDKIKSLPGNSNTSRKIRISFAVQPAAWAQAQRHGRAPACRSGLPVNGGAGCTSMLRFGRHILVPAARVVPTLA